MDVLRDHRRNDLRHDRDDHRVRCNVNRRDHRVMDDRHVNRKNGLQDVDHRLPLDDRHRMGFLCVDDLKLGVSRVNRSCAPHDLKMDGNLVVNRGHHMNDRLGDHLMDDDHRDVLGDLRMNGMDDLNDRNLGVNLCHRMNDPLDDHLMDDGHRDVLVGRRTNVTDDLNLGASRVNRNCVRHDLKMDAKMDGNLYHHTNVMDDRNDLTMVVSLDVSRGLRMNDRLDDPNLDANHENHNCVRHDLNLDVNLDAMSHRVMYC